MNSRMKLKHSLCCPPLNAARPEITWCCDSSVAWGRPCLSLDSSARRSKTSCFREPTVQQSLSNCVPTTDNHRVCSPSWRFPGSSHHQHVHHCRKVGHNLLHAFCLMADAELILKLLLLILVKSWIKLLFVCEAKMLACWYTCAE